MIYLNSKIRSTLFVLLIITPLAVLASSYGGAHGKNRLGQVIHVEADGPTRFYVEDEKRGKSWVAYTIAEECPGWVPDSKQQTFSCLDNRTSPLAGTTYQVLMSKTIMNTCDNPAIIYKCVEGCQPKRVPLIIIEEPWEC